MDKELCGGNMRHCVMSLVVCFVALWVVLASKVLSSDEIGSLDIRSIPGNDDYGLASAHTTPDGKQFVYYLCVRGGSDTVEYTRVIDSIMSCVPIKPSDSLDLSYLACKSDSVILLALDILKPHVRDTLLTLFFPDCSIGKINTYFFSRREALLGLSGLLPDSTGEPWHVIIGRITSRDSMDTIAYVSGGNSVTLSSDGTEVFLNRFTKFAPNTIPTISTAVYDLVADSLLDPLSKATNTSGAFRLARELPLYYLRADPVSGTNVWRWDAIRGEEQVSHFLLPQWVTRFNLTKDSVLCVVVDQSHKTAGELIVSIPLEASGIK